MLTPNPTDATLVGNIVDAPSTLGCILSMDNPDPRNRRGIDFAAIDRAAAITAQWVKEAGPDAVVEGFAGRTTSGLHTAVRHVQEAAEPHRPKVRRA